MAFVLDFTVLDRYLEVECRKSKAQGSQYFALRLNAGGAKINLYLTRQQLAELASAIDRAYMGYDEEDEAAYSETANGEREALPF